MIDSITNYYELKDNSLETIEYPEKNIPELLMEINYIDNKKIPSMIDNIERLFTYKVNNTYIGPIDDNMYERNSIKKYINTVTDIHINYQLKTYIPFYYNNNFECFLWVRRFLIQNIKQSYSFVHRAHFVVTLDINRAVCDGNKAFNQIYLP